MISTNQPLTAAILNEQLEQRAAAARLKTILQIPLQTINVSEVVVELPLQTYAEFYLYSLGIFRFSFDSNYSWERRINVNFPTVGTNTPLQVGAFASPPYGVKINKHHSCYVGTAIFLQSTVINRAVFAMICDSKSSLVIKNITSMFWQDGYIVGRTWS